MKALLNIQFHGNLPVQLVWDKAAKAFRESLLALEAQKKAGIPIEITCPCGQPLVLQIRHRTSPSRLPLPIVSSWPDATHHDPSCLCSLRPKQPLIDLPDVQSAAQAFGNAGQSSGSWRLRLAAVHKRLIGDLAKVSKKPPCGQTPARPSAAISKCIGGIFDGLSEAAGLCFWSAYRNYALGVPSALRHLEQHCTEDSMLREAVGNRTVFYHGGALGTDIADAEQKTASALDDRVLIVFRCRPTPRSQGAWYAPDGIELRHSALVLHRLAQENLHRIQKFTKENSDAEAICIALVHREGEALIVDDCAWRLVDRFGIIYSSAKEFRAGRQLVAAGIAFAKPAQTVYRVAGHRHIPDFILLHTGRNRFVVEVDPSAGKKTTRRKALRDQHYRASGIHCIKWSGKKDDLLTEMIAGGFAGSIT